MAATATGAMTPYEEYGISLAESVWDAIQIIDRDDHIFFSELPKSKGKQIKEEWLEESLTTFSDNAHTDAEDYSYSQRSPRTRLSNWMQYFSSTWRVGKIRDAVEEYGVATQYAHAMRLTMREHPTDIERALTYGQSASGASSTATAIASKMRGLCDWITSHTASGTGSASFTSDAFIDILEEIVTANSGKPFWVVMAPKLKRQVSTYTTPLNRYVYADEKKLTFTISVFESDFGVCQCEYNIWLAAANDKLNSSYDRALFLDRSKWSIATLMPTQVEEVPPQGFYKQGVMNTVCTLIALAEACNGQYLASSS